ncbi:30S ribosomal protein S6 [Candidatus Peregrinibacteria bacterium CG10_big_fil_rev_8_21_14_0_10_49_10]|nr:MAG: 30S ribosomal protein S6 [Candidatus Peregrinibacteria bacterium CG10_big_fil_rev_8_21_14_0_10_49_10]
MGGTRFTQESPMPTLTASSEDVRVYEVAVLYPSVLHQKEEQQTLKEVETLFAEAGAKLMEKDAWSRRGLAYSIRGHKEGNFVMYYFEMDPAKLKEVDEALRIIPHILRHLIVKPPKGYQVIKFSAEYDQWLKTRETDAQKKDREKEEALQRQVADKAKRQARRATEKKKEIVEESSPIEEDKLTEELEKLISDDELDI